MVILSLLYSVLLFVRGDPGGAELKAFQEKLVRRVEGVTFLADVTSLPSHGRAI